MLKGRETSLAGESLLAPNCSRRQINPNHVNECRFGVPEV